MTGRPRANAVVQRARLPCRVRAGMEAGRVDRIVYVGGSSLMSVVPETMRAIFPEAEHSFASVFTAVAEGLAIVGARQEG